MRKTILMILALLAQSVIASDPEIVEAKAELTPAQKYNIAVTIKHEDTGWDHYASGWRVYSPKGELLDERVLHHPHVKEQPFTRSLYGVEIPSEVTEIVIKANCSETKESKKGYSVKLR